MRVAIGAIGLVAVLVGVGYVYQTTSERRDLREHPAPGRLVDVGGGHWIHLDRPDAAVEAVRRMVFLTRE